MDLRTEAIEDLADIKGVSVPAGVKFRELLVTGPPASGKSSLVTRLGGWPEEGFLDLGIDWWRQHGLTLRPREVHLVFPVAGIRETVSVTDSGWPEAGGEIDLARVRIPPRKRWVLGVDWLHRYVFDFQLPRPETLVEIRHSGIRGGTHPRDRGLDVEQARAQLAAYAAIALHFQRCGVRVYVRTKIGGAPRRVLESQG